MKFRNAKVSALCALSVTALVMTSTAWAGVRTSPAASEAESAAESTAQEAVSEESAQEEAVSEAESAAEEAESVAESAAEEAVSEAESAAEEAASEAESAAEAAESEASAEETEVPRPEYNGADYVTLGDYEGLTLEVDPIEITDEEIDQRIQSDIQGSEAGKEEITEGTVEEGDLANIDYEGKKDGVAFDGGTAEGYDLEIGSGTFIEGFEDGLIGVAIGDTVDLNLTFPEEYGNEELAGQDVVFTVTVNYVTRYKELDDELASELSDGEASTVEEYRERTKAMLEEDALRNRTESSKDELLVMACSDSTISEYPQDLLDYYVNDITNYYQYYASMYGVDFNTFLTVMMGTTEEDFPQYAEEMAKQSIGQEFTIDAIAEAESLLPEGEDLAAAYDEIAQEFGYEDGASLIADYGEYAVNYRLAYNAVRDFIYENATITEKEPEEAESEAAEAVESEAAESEAAVSEAVTSEAVASEAVESEAAASEAVESEAVESEAAASEAAK